MVLSLAKCGLNEIFIELHYNSQNITEYQDKHHFNGLPLQIHEIHLLLKLSVNCSLIEKKKSYRKKRKKGILTVCNIPLIHCINFILTNSLFASSIFTCARDGHYWKGGRVKNVARQKYCMHQDLFANDASTSELGIKCFLSKSHANRSISCIKSKNM